ncbi:MAG: HD domain-containing protein [Planctomycetaceae bacterium]
MTLPFFDIPELAQQDAGQGLVRIPYEQDVPFTRRVRALVDTAEFRRLAQISQLGLVSRIYPGAMHTRFEHALGVFHNALGYLRQLGKDRRFCESVDRHSAEVLLASALLHDLGHWPFCHPIEDLGLSELPAHETFAAEFLAPERELSRVLRDEWNVDPTEVLEVLAPGRKSHAVASGTKNPKSPPARLRLLRSILSGPIDIDKMDYLARDSLHCGVPYGRNFDKNRLMQSLLVNAQGDGLAISYKGKTAAELMVFARYVMFSEVYWHHAVRAATCMFGRAFYELRQQLDLRALFAQTEADFIHALREAARGTDSELLLQGLFGPKRCIYKRLVEATSYQEVELYEALARRPIDVLATCATRLAGALGQRIGQHIAATEIVIDAPPDNREVEFEVDLFFPRENRYRPLHEVSPVVRALAGTQFDDYVKRVRIFAHPRIAAELKSLPRLVLTVLDLI